MAFPGPGNGQWVRTRTEADAKSFVDEKQMEADRQRDWRARERRFFARVFGWLRSRIRR